MKSIYLISFNEKVQGEVISNKIKALGSWLSYFDNQWLVETEKTEKEIYQLLQTKGSEFRILIMKIDILNSWGWMPKDAWVWLDTRTKKGSS